MENNEPSLAELKIVFVELISLVDKMKPMIETIQIHTLAHEAPPNELMAKIARTYSETIGRLRNIVPGDPSLDNMESIMARAAKAYDEDDQVEIAIINAELMGINFMSIRSMITSMQEMIGVMSDAEDQGPPGGGNIILPGDDDFPMGL